MSEELMKVPQVMELTDLGRDTVYRLIREGQIPSVRLGRAIRVPRTALMTYLERLAEDAVSRA